MRSSAHTAGKLLPPWAQLQARVERTRQRIRHFAPAPLASCDVDMHHVGAWHARHAVHGCLAQHAAQPRQPLQVTSCSCLTHDALPLRLRPTGAAVLQCMQRHSLPPAQPEPLLPAAALQHQGAPALAEQRHRHVQVVEGQRVQHALQCGIGQVLQGAAAVGRCCRLLPRKRRQSGLLLLGGCCGLAGCGQHAGGCEEPLRTLQASCSQRSHLGALLLPPWACRPGLRGQGIGSGTPHRNHCPAAKWACIMWAHGMHATQCTAAWPSTLHSRRGGLAWAGRCIAGRGGASRAGWHARPTQPGLWAHRPAKLEVALRNRTSTSGWHDALQPGARGASPRLGRLRGSSPCGPSSAQAGPARAARHSPPVRRTTRASCQPARASERSLSTCAIGRAAMCRPSAA